jgi:hypothetical protein
MANLAPGVHEAVLYADGQIIAQHAFNTAALSSGEFAEDLDGCAISEGFPTSDKDTIAKWTTSMQGFQITEERVRPLAENIDGFWSAPGWDVSIWTYRTDCGVLSLFMHANIEVDVDKTSLLFMAGQLGKEKTLLRSTPNDAAEREATLLIRESSEMQIDFTACGPQLALACDFTPAGGRIIIKKTPNIMETATR